MAPRSKCSSCSRPPPGRTSAPVPGPGSRDRPVRQRHSRNRAWSSQRAPRRRRGPPAAFGRPWARGQDSPWQALSGCSQALSRATSSSTRTGSPPVSFQATQGMQREGPARVLAARKNSRSRRCPGIALSCGNSVPMVLPIPVGAWAIRQQPAEAALYTASASCRWPWRNSAWGKRNAASSRSRRWRCASSCSAQARNAWHWLSKNSRSSSARTRLDEARSPSGCRPPGRPAPVRLLQLRSAQSSQP